jgi:hypothetical protein
VFEEVEGEKIATEVILGTLTYGQLEKVEYNCVSPFWSATNHFAIGTAQIDTNACAMQGTGNSTVYNYYAVDVMDSNERLDEAFRGIQKHFDLDQVELHYTNTHHNWCDNFYLRVPSMDVEYAIINQANEHTPTIDGEKFLGTAVKYRDEWIVISTEHSVACY